MQVYTVGGWVRDRLLGRDAGGDRDWVVVGATPEQMCELGFTPVGRDFPVFLHPQTREEYALARTERKTAPGYRGFVVHAAPDVTLEQDLARRDLTINAIALDEHGSLIDPYDGQRDLQQRVLRHVGPAFAEDPVRILRLARFAARFAGFCVADETLALARAMVGRGEADALVPERVWQELARGLMEERPSRMVEVLEQTGLVARLYPELGDLQEVKDALDRAVQRALALPARFAILCTGARSRDALRGLLAKLRADQDSAQLAGLLYDLRAPLGQAAPAADRLAVLERADALRRPARFELLLQAYETLARENADPWRRVAAAAAAIDAGAIAARCGGDTKRIAREVSAARLEAVERALALTPGPSP